MSQGLSPPDHFRNWRHRGQPKQRQAGPGPCAGGEADGPVCGRVHFSLCNEAQYQAKTVRLSTSRGSRDYRSKVRGRFSKESSTEWNAWMAGLERRSYLFSDWVEKPPHGGIELGMGVPHLPEGSAPDFMKEFDSRKLSTRKLCFQLCDGSSYSAHVRRSPDSPSRA